MITALKAPSALRTILFLAGAGIVALGINVGFGGMATLGWQGPTDFLAVADAEIYAVQDNHVRFLGGFWLGAGGMFLVGSFMPDRLNAVLTGICMMIFVGGLVRLSALDSALVLGADILPSLLLELIGFPLLAYWLYRSREKDI